MVTANGDLPDNDRSLLMSKCRGPSVEKEANNNMLKRRGSPGNRSLDFNLLRSFSKKKCLKLL
jgi:hypothetical protein